jgi:hypothetical protein
MAPSSALPAHRVGVGIDTSRYGHYAAFLRDDLQPVPYSGSAVLLAGPERTL